MGRAKAWLRIGVLAALVIALTPLHLVALVIGGSWVGILPRLFHRLGLWLIGVRVIVEGAPAARRPLLVVSNHASWLDIAVLGAQLPVSFVARADMRDWLGFGVLARLQRSVFVDRTRRSAASLANAEIRSRLSAGEAIVLFAEGTTSDGNRILPFRTALFAAAEPIAGERERFWVQPVAVAYWRMAGLPIGRMGRPGVAWYGDMTLGPHLLAVFAGPILEVRVLWGDAIEVSGGFDRKSLAGLMEARVRSLFSRAISGRCAASAIQP